VFESQPTSSALYRPSRCNPVSNLNSLLVFWASVACKWICSALIDVHGCLCSVWCNSLTCCSCRFFENPASPLGGATTTSSQIYLSRGVAGTRNTPALPLTDRCPASVASHTESPHSHSLSLSPPLTPSSAGKVSRRPDPIIRPLMDSRDSRRKVVDTEGPPPELGITASSHVEASSPHTKRSDVLRHVFPRSHLTRNSSVTSGITSRMVKLSHRGSPHASSARHARPRVSFHKALTSFFNTSPTETTAPITKDRNASKSPNIRSRANSNSLHGSMPSVEFVSSGAFIFSGPSLRSQSGSFSNSTPRLPSLGEDSDDFSVLRREYPDTFPFDDILVSQPTYHDN
jgi:hypothetical protein